MRIVGLDPVGPIVIDRVDVMGTAAATVAYTDPDGVPRERMLFPADLEGLDVQMRRPGPTFDADPDEFRLAAEALRLRYAASFDRLLAVHASDVEPLPHQIKAVYEEMLPRRPLRFLLADDPGAGKTIMAGLYIKEVLARRIARRILIVAPGSLVDQWQEELATKFGLPFDIFDRQLHAAADGGNAFASHDLLICRVDQLARDDRLRQALRETSWDLSIVDEAHKMTARWWGAKVVKSKRYQLGETLSQISRNFLLMTATPHSGKEADFQLFMSLLDADRFVGRPSDHPERPDAGDLMRRLVKEQLRHLDGRPLFPERIASTVPYELTPLEMELYEEVSDYVRHEMNKTSGEEARTVGFALLILQRRVASSPEAALQSLTRRRQKLQEQADAMSTADRDLDRLLRRSIAAVDPDEEDDLLGSELEQVQDAAVGGASASRTLPELLTEIQVLDRLVDLAERVRNSGVDRKWEELASLLTAPRMYDQEGRRRKIIIFTEHRDTLDYLDDRITQLLGSPHHMVSIHGGDSRGDRRLAQEAFLDDPDVSVLLATDAAGEGVNLQKANLMVNYDLPWNPNRLEQRFGRIHRIGQTEVCHLWNLVAANTREGDVFTTLLEKLETQREALGDKVFDVLGEVLSGSELTALLSQAIQYGDRPEVRARLRETVSDRVVEDLRRAVTQRTESVSELTDQDLVALRRSMAVATAITVQPHAVEDFVRAALPRARGEIVDAGAGRVRIPRLGEHVRDRGAGLGGQRVARRYDDVTFTTGALHLPGRPPAELLAPGHPLVDALTDVVLDEVGSALQQGAVLVDRGHPEDTVVVVSRLEATTDDGQILAEDVVAARVAEDGGVEELAPSYLLACPVVPADAAQPPTIDETAFEDVERWVQDVAAPRLADHVRAALTHQRASSMDIVRSRLTAEIKRIRGRAESLAQDRDHDPDEVAALHAAADAMATRLGRRERELMHIDDAVTVRHETLAVAAVIGEVQEDETAAPLPDHAMVQLRGLGFDAVVFSADGEARFVRRRLGQELMADLVARNVGDAFV